MNAYNVTIERTTRSWADITVSAKSFDEAQALAASVQHHAEYVGFTHTYLVTEVEPDTKEDVLLTAKQLDDKYNPDGGGEHPIHIRDLWREAVLGGVTLLGYWDWVEYQIELKTNE
jgi:hypothetical protein